MATAAERQRRSRAHRAGDHSHCDLARCDALQGVTPAPVEAAPVTVPSRPAVTATAPAVAEPATPPDVPGAPGEIEAEVAAFVDKLNFDGEDPRRILCRIAVKLARRVDASDATSAAIRQLTVLLAQLAEVPDQPAGPLDGARAQRAARRLGTLIGRAR